jgi:hypothetical protein
MVCQGGFVFSFSAHPATITVTQGIQDAFAYLSQTWKTWLPVVIVIALCELLVRAVVGSVSTANLYYSDPYTNQITWSTNSGAVLGRLIWLELLTIAVSTIGGWVFVGLAVAGLRRQPLTASRVINRGLLTIVYTLVVLAVVGVAAVALILVTVLVPPIGVLLLLVATPVAIYVAIRLVFANLAIFDGFGPIDAAYESWRLSQSSVLRLLGWGLMAWLIDIGFGIVAGIASLPFTAGGSDSVGGAISTGVGTVGSCLTVFMMAALYESQRARMDMNLYGPVPMYGGYGYPSPPPAIPGWVDPNAPAQYGYPQQPPAPYGYPQQPPAPYGYPQQPPTAPGWVNPGAPPPPYGWVNPNPQPPAFNYPGQAQPGSGWLGPQPPATPAYPSAPQVWVAPPQAGPAPQTPPAAQPDAGPTEPPAATEPPAPTDPPATT